MPNEMFSHRNKKRRAGDDACLSRPGSQYHLLPGPGVLRKRNREGWRKWAALYISLAHCSDSILNREYNFDMACLFK